MWPAVLREADHGHKMLSVPTVLIVDDHTTFRAMVRAVLEADGFEVVGDAADGGAGLAAVAALHPDLVLLDVRLPDGDGFSIAQQLSGRRDSPAVIVTSSSDDPRYPDLARRSGALGFVAKHDLCGTTLRSLLP